MSSGPEPPTTPVIGERVIPFEEIPVFETPEAFYERTLEAIAAMPAAHIIAEHSETPRDDCPGCIARSAVMRCREGDRD